MHLLRSNIAINMAISRRPAKSVSIAEARDKLAELIYAAEESGPIGITRRGTPVAVLLAAAEYTRLQNAAVSPDLAAWLAHWRSQLPAGFEIGAEELARWQEPG